MRNVPGALAKQPSQGGPLRISGLASRFGLSERTLSRRFAAATGRGPQAYVRHARVQQAMRLLEMASDPVDQVRRASATATPPRSAASSRRPPGCPRQLPRRLRTPEQHGQLSAASPGVGRAGDALDDVEVGHHRHVLVLEVVAVEDVAPAIAGEPRDDLGFLFGPQVDGVLPAYVIRPPAALRSGKGPGSARGAGGRGGARS